MSGKFKAVGDVYVRLMVVAMTAEMHGDVASANKIQGALDVLESVWPDDVGSLKRHLKKQAKG
jgi:hypothetical protein